jgi:hypothetical protein
MPQIKTGQVIPGVGEAPKPYGLDKVENAIPFQERLMRLFKPQEFVTIKNITDEACYWQYMPQDSETENFSEDGMQRIITREDPEMWVILPGETEVLVGASAYRALDVMYKNFAAASTLRKFKDPSAPQYNEKNEHLPKNFNFADGGAQDAFIKKAYLGKATPTFGNIEQPMQPAPAAPAQATPPAEPAVDPNLPKPKTTEGAPLAKPQYAEPDAPARPAKELTGAKSK